MEFIKNDKDFLLNANDLLSLFGHPSVIAQKIDDLIFSYIELACKNADCVADYQWDVVSTAREVRDLINSIKTDLKP